ncbi:MAG: CoA transferase [Dehalococcoidia bacterium]|nr:MAG: CoA transferase [Dehalococcoidia bacterium]
MAEQPLSDVQILDLTWYISGPNCTKLFADYGADVIKVEKPGEGDPARRMGPFFKDDPHPEKSGLFLHLNTNKRSITLNLKSATGKRILKDLVKDADILVENFSPHVMPSLGLDYETLEKINPKLVMTSISNFGQTGPYRDFRASELIIYGMGGAMCSTGVGDCEPVKKGMNVIQYQGGTTAAAATMIALYAASAQGIGQHVDISLMETQMAAIDRRMSELLAYEYNKELTPRMDIAGLLQYPYGIFPCSDGYVDVAGGFMFLNRIERVLKVPLMETYGGMNQFDVERREEFFSTIWYPWVMERTRREIVEACQAERVFSAPINTTEDLLNEPQFQERGFWVEVDHPVVGKVTYPGRPALSAELPWMIRRPAPLLGEHNEEVYTPLGYAKEDLVKLREGGII